MLTSPSSVAFGKLIGLFFKRINKSVKNKLIKYAAIICYNEKLYLEQLNTCSLVQKTWYA